MSETGTSPCVEPPSKKQCLEDVRREFEDVVTDSNHKTPDHQHPNPQADQLKEKRSQLVLGVNSVSRELERDGLRAGIVCLSAKPAVLHRHLVMLASTRGVPFAGLRDFSKTVTPLLGVKSALAVGFKVRVWQVVTQWFIPHPLNTTESEMAPCLDEYHLISPMTLQCTSVPNHLPCASVTTMFGKTKVA